MLSGAAEKEVKSYADVQALMREGERMKRKAATAMNDRSSRAHSMIIAKVRQRNLHNLKEISSSLFMVDLGGSEQVVGGCKSDYFVVIVSIAQVGHCSRSTRCVW